VLLAGALISLLMAVVFYLLNVAESASALSMAKADVQSEARRAIDWISKDVRQTVNWSIGSASNNPSSSHIKFQKVSGFDTAGVGSPTFGGFIEYTFDSSSKTITRKDFSNNRTWIFRNVAQPPFYTRKIDNSVVVIDPVSSGDDSPVLTTGNLVVVIAGQKNVKSGTVISATLSEEIKIRN
jgi:hypothetical protein